MAGAVVAVCQAACKFVPAHPFSTQPASTCLLAPCNPNPVLLLTHGAGGDKKATRRLLLEVAASRRRGLQQEEAASSGGGSASGECDNPSHDAVKSMAACEASCKPKTLELDGSPKKGVSIAPETYEGVWVLWCRVGVWVLCVTRG